jgi:hypothetical protein
MSQKQINKANALKWVEALESGDYPQDPTGGYLKTEAGYCCLGVLVEVAGEEFHETEQLRNPAGRKIYKMPNGACGLPGTLTSQFLGTDYDHHGSSVLVQEATVGEIGVHMLNDRGASFKDIARLVRHTFNLGDPT